MTSGGKTRQYQLIRALSARGARITLLVQSKEPADLESVRVLEACVEQLIVLPRRRSGHVITVLAGLFGPWPLMSCINGIARRLTAQLDALLAQSWDIVQIEHSYFFQPCAAALRRTRRSFVLTEHNLESSLGNATYGRFPRWARLFVIWDQWRAKRWERYVFQAAQRIVAVTPDDARAISALTSTPVAVVVNGVDCGYFSRVAPDLQSQRLLFLGNYDYPPNRDAVEWLLHDIMPRIWLAMPRVRIAIVGHGLSHAWAARWTDPRVEWHGYVADLRSLQVQSHAFLAPLRHGGGSKLKVLEALAAGLPLVTTSQGASGLALQDQSSALFAETADEFAAQTQRVLSDRVLAIKLSEHGRDYVQTNHDWSFAAQQLMHMYQECIEESRHADSD